MLRRFSHVPRDLDCRSPRFPISRFNDAWLEVVSRLLFAQRPFALGTSKRSPTYCNLPIITTT